MGFLNNVKFPSVSDVSTRLLETPSDANSSRLDFNPWAFFVGNVAGAAEKGLLLVLLLPISALATLGSLLLFRMASSIRPASRSR